MPQTLTLELKGIRAGAASAYRLHAPTTWTTNTLERPDVVTPNESRVQVTAGMWVHTLPENTIEVLDIPLQ